MHTDLKALHSAVEALLKADQAVKKAARAYDREATPPRDVSYQLREGVSFPTTPKQDALERATRRKEKATYRVEDLWDQLNLDDTPTTPVS